jgi:hypothetical protein
MLDDGESHGRVTGHAWDTPGSASSLRRTSQYKPDLRQSGERHLFWVLRSTLHQTVPRAAPETRRR